MKSSHITALAEAVRRARRELEISGQRADAVSQETAIKRLAELLDSDDVNEALAAVSDAPSMQADPPVDLRVPDPWRKH